ncbi:GHKL domain-containing protein [candidate division KSB1 bacterium]|nr:GHKL domain-containing protein [candidate division KSB1 bacterium]
MENSPFKKILFTIIIAVLVPVLSYTAFQFFQTNKNEELIKSIYDRQLNTILFSVNQHCWDILNSWIAEIRTIIDTGVLQRQNPSGYPEELATFTRNNPTVSGAFINWTPSHTSLYMDFQSGVQPPRVLRFRYENEINHLISESSQHIDRMIRRAKEGYIKPHIIPWSTGRQELMILVFPVIRHKSLTMPVLAGIMIDSEEYVSEVVARKFSSMNDDIFSFAVQDRENGQVLYATEQDEEVKDYEKSEELWILPNLDLKIKLSGTTLKEISRDKTTTNLIFLLVSNLVFITGILYLLRNVSQEMTLSRMKTAFVANVSHELRTPLALIRMYAETLEMNRVRSDDKRNQYYRTIMSESTRLTQLINNILDFSKIESRKKEYQLAPESLRHLIEQTLEMYQFHLDQKDFQLALDLQSDLPDIGVDSEAITQSLVNLIDNAIKNSPNEKFIRIQLYRENGHQVIAITDKGVGIPESEQKKIFEKFYRIESGLVHNTKGSGLGLSLVKHIMQIHGGSVSVKSKVDHGSTFYLKFPTKKSGQYRN